MYFKIQKTVRALLVVACILFVQYASPAQEIQFPDDAGIVNIKEAPYNAKGDGVTDDTQAILSALKDWNYSNRDGQSATIYFPEGTYLVSQTLEAVDHSGITQCGVRLHGQGIDKTIIKLVDNAPGFSGSPTPVIRTHGKDGGRGNAGYGNYIQYLTVDVGSGNPGAIGVHYKVSNWGAMSHVKIKSSDPNKAGKYGIMIDDISGAGLVRYTAIDGFDYALYTETVVNNIVFDSLKISNQRIAGILNQDKNLAIYGLESNNSVPAIMQTTSQAYLALVNAHLNGGDPVNAAILHTEEAFLFARNVTVNGYGTAIDTPEGAHQADVTGANVTIDEWLSHPPAVKAWEDSPSKSIDLPVKHAPEYHTNDFSKWANVKSFGATADDNLDDTQAIQDAIDSGAEIVYFPLGKYVVSDTVFVRNKVRKMDFVWSLIESDGSGKIVVEDTEGDFVILENAMINKVDLIHSSSKALSINFMHFASGEITNTEKATGDLFVTDVGPWPKILLKNGIKAWIRQLNREWIMLENDASIVWVFGMNVEAKDRKVQPFKTINGGISEIIGGAMDPLSYEVTKDLGSLFTVINSSISVTVAGNERGSGYFELCFKDQRDDELRSVYHPEFISGDGRFVIMLYTGYKEEIVSDAPNIGVDKSDFKVYPIPVKGQATIKPPTHTGYNFELINIFGQKILSKSDLIGNYSFSTEELQSGIYLLHISTDAEDYCQKLIK